MELEYSSTIDEILDTQMLSLEESNIFIQWIAWGILLWVLTAFLIVYFGEGALINKLLIGVFLGGIVGGRMVFGYKALIRKRLKKVIVKKRGDANPFPARVKLTDDKIEYSSEHLSMAFQLSALKQVRNVEEGIALYFRRGGLLYIPDTAFGSEDVQMRWKNRLHEILTGNR